MTESNLPEPSSPLTWADVREILEGNPFRPALISHPGIARVRESIEEIRGLTFPKDAFMHDDDGGARRPRGTTPDSSGRVGYNGEFYVPESKLDAAIEAGRGHADRATEYAARIDELDAQIERTNEAVARSRSAERNAVGEAQTYREALEEIRRLMSTTVVYFFELPHPLNEQFGAMMDMLTQRSDRIHNLVDVALDGEPDLDVLDDTLDEIPEEWFEGDYVVMRNDKRPSPMVGVIQSIVEPLRVTVAWPESGMVTTVRTDDLAHIDLNDR